MDILIIVLTVLALSFMTAFALVLYRLKRMAATFAKLYMAQNILDNFLSEKLTEPVKTDEEIHKENFIKFLSDSRDWAFQYIEDVQRGLKGFISAVEPALDSYTKNKLPDNLLSPNDIVLNNIVKEFETLKNLMPEDLNDRR